jgi:hypothetical protein
MGATRVQSCKRGRRVVTEGRERCAHIRCLSYPKTHLPIYPHTSSSAAAAAAAALISYIHLKSRQSTAASHSSSVPNYLRHHHHRSGSSGRRPNLSPVRNSPVIPFVLLDPWTGLIIRASSGEEDDDDLPSQNCSSSQELWCSRLRWFQTWRKEMLLPYR